MNHRLQAAFLVAVLLGVTSSAHAQPLLFGSLDDPQEAPRRAWWLKERYIEPLAGLSLIGAQWRTASRFRTRLEARDAALELDGSLRAGIYGRYDSDTDEPYDLARLVSFARIRTERGYLRLGAPTRTRMGSGQLIDFYNGTSVWDERNIGLELALSGRVLGIQAIASDARFSQLVAARAELRPFGDRIQIGAGAALDRSIDLEARELDFRFVAARSAGFRLLPFAGISEIRDHGRSLMLGADLGTDNFIDVATLHARLAVQYAEDEFQPGYFGPFYDVTRRGREIVGSDLLRPFSSLAETASGTYVISELRMHFFERFELWYMFRRHYGAGALSTFHIRVFVRTRRLIFAYAEDRGGLRGFFSLFNDVGDLSLMSFRTDYHLAGPVWLRVDARYGYVRLLPSQDPVQFAVQRRFEPYVGVRFNF